MENIEFESAEIKELYQDILKDNDALSGIIIKIIQNSDSIKIKKIVDNTSNIKIVISKNDEVIIVEIDLSKKKIYVQYPNIIYKEIYSNHQKMLIEPIGYLYENKERSITKKVLRRLNSEINTRYYELNDGTSDYAISVNDSNNMFDEDYFINKLLYDKNKYYRIKDLLLTILDGININNVCIKICDSKGSCVVIENGLVAKYLEILDNSDELKKIYLENDKLFIEKLVKEEYQDEDLSLIKKIGVINGKER